ncbi:MAG: hypothetical protein M1828_005049 [Chrysothrix sp. TS-e1954]|nr:MAG: hypothetical protein M1828_005049 [Chrysothrix sp. TS-e1954]
MMHTFLLFCLSTLLAGTSLAQRAAAQLAADIPIWYYTVAFELTKSQGFTSITGDISVPPWVKPDSKGIWAGLQDKEEVGVLQEILAIPPDGTDVAPPYWDYYTGWFDHRATPQMTDGKSLKVLANSTVSFNLTYDGPNWDSSPKYSSGSGGLGFYLAVFAVELQYNATWDFGPITFSNIVMTALGTDQSWCDNKPHNSDNTTDYTISGVSASAGSTAGPAATLDENTVTCTIEQLVLLGPSSSSGNHTQEGVIDVSQGDNPQPVVGNLSGPATTIMDNVPRSATSIVDNAPRFTGV